MRNTYTFHYDSGHGWLRVPRRDIDFLGIGKKITSYSHQTKDGKSVFLEEDVDASTFLKEYRFRTGKEPNTKVKNDGDNSPIRRLSSFES